jgi:TonB family protein
MRVFAALPFAIFISLSPYAYCQSKAPASESIETKGAPAEKGDVYLENNLGEMYAIGRGVPQDYAEAVKWYRKAADAGYARAQFNLGMSYVRGQGVMIDYGEAVKWFRKLADRGFAPGQTNLGIAYSTGRGVPRDIDEALKWFRLAADAGNAVAQFNLGLAYKQGEGVPQDISEAKKWFGLAAEQGMEPAKRELAVLSGDGFGGGAYRIGGGVSAPNVLSKVAPEYSNEARAARLEGTVVLSLVVDQQGRPQNLKVVRSLGLGLDTKAIEAVEKWSFKPGMKDGKPVPVMASIEINFKLAPDVDSKLTPDPRNVPKSEPSQTNDFKQRVRAVGGDAVSQLNLGLRYAKGQGVPQDYKEAARLIRKAAEKELPRAQFILGVMYARGQGLTRDYSEAADWWRKAANAGDVDAQYELGIAYAQSRGVSRDDAEAVKWFRKATEAYRKAADKGDAGAQATLGNIYAKGQGVTQDYAEAAGWWRKAADAGNPGAQYSLGLAYAQGQGVAQNLVFAHMWLTLSAAIPSETQELRAKERFNIAKQLTPEQLAESQRLAVEWKSSSRK